MTRPTKKRKERTKPDLRTLEVFTTGQVAKICKMSPRTVKTRTIFVDGSPELLRAFRIPGSQERRFERQEVIRFLKYHEMPLGELEDKRHGVVIVSEDEAIGTGLADLMKSDQCDVVIARDVFQAGIEVKAINPRIVVVDFSIGLTDALSILKNLHMKPEYQHIAFVAVLSEGHVELEHCVKPEWFLQIWQRPINLHNLAFHVGKLLERGQLVVSESVAA